MEKARILVVEDENIVAMDICARLGGLHYDVVGTASTGEAAVRKAAETRPDLILMDVKLRGAMDGIEAAARIKQVRPTPVIFLTAFSDEATLQRAKQTDAYGYILKPFEERDLYIAIEIALNKHQAEEKLKEREAYFRALIEHSSDAVLVVNAGGEILYASPSIDRVLGLGSAPLTGDTLLLYAHYDDKAKVSKFLTEDLRAPGATSTVRFRFRHSDGTWHVLEATGCNHIADPVVAGVVVNMRDITERVRAEEALRESEERFSLAVSGANDGVWDWNLRTNLVYLSARWLILMGYSEGEIGCNINDMFRLIHPDELPGVMVNLNAHLAGLSEHFQSEHRQMHKDGQYRWVLLRGMAVRDASGQFYRMAGSLTDITARKHTEEQLLHDAFHDGLTALPNRALFIDRLRHAIERSRRGSDHLFAVILVDLDLFKVINDSLGHQAGDELLIAMGLLLKGSVRSGDTVARLGGDEFGVLLEDTSSPEDVRLIAQRIQEELQQPFDIIRQIIYSSASMGIVFSSTEYETAEEVLRDADIAMYQAKASGKACFVEFDLAMRRQAISRLSLENDLRVALGQNQFYLQYQPIVALATGRLTGFEALLRWRHPVHGEIAPGGFIPLAEETGLILPIGWWVLREACRQLAAWREKVPGSQWLTVNVNISGRHFFHTALIEQVEAVLLENNLDASALRLEMTESVFIENAGVALSVIQRLRERGIQLHIDDFGTGYSSLSYVQHFPVDAIKIDRTFISRIGGAGGNGEIVPAILRMAADLGMQAVAEGVETEMQAERLKELGCPFAQGFYFSHPLDADKAEALLRWGVVSPSSQELAR